MTASSSWAAPEGEFGPNWMGRDAVVALTKLRDEHGDMIAIREHIGLSYFVMRASVAHKVLSGNAGGFAKRIDNYESLQTILGKGILVCPDGDLWKQKRQLIAPFFRQDNVDTLVATIHERVAEVLDAWATPDFTERDVAKEYGRLVARLASSVIFGQDVANDEADAFWTLISRLTGLAHELQAASQPLSVETPDSLEFHRLLEQIRQKALSCIEAAQAGKVRAGCLLDIVVKAAAEPGSFYTPEDLRDEVITLIGASTEGLIYAMTYVTYMLATVPETLAGVRAEVDAVVEGKGPPTAAQLSAMPYLRAVIDETLRLHPPVWFFLRHVTRDLTVDEFEFKEGARVVVAINMLHRDPRHWDDPSEYRPERFLDGKPTNQAYMPFGVGPRSCVGARLALLELRATMVHLIRTLEFSPRMKLEPVAAIALTPNGEIRMATRSRRR